MERRRVVTEVLAAVDGDRIVGVRHALVIRDIAQTSVPDILLVFDPRSQRRVARVNARVPERQAGQLLRASVVYNTVVSAVVGHVVDLVWANVGAVAIGQHGDDRRSLVSAFAVVEGPHWAAREDYSGG